MDDTFPLVDRMELVLKRATANPDDKDLQRRAMHLYRRMVDTDAANAPQYEDRILEFCWAALDAKPMYVQAVRGAFLTLQKLPSVDRETIISRFSEPDMTDPWCKLVTLLLSGKFSKAVEYLRSIEDWQSISMNDVQFWRRAAQAMLRAGNTVDDQRFFDRALIALGHEDVTCKRIQNLRAQKKLVREEIVLPSWSIGNGAWPATSLGIATALVANRPPVEHPQENSGDLVILGGSLAGGGAERLMANAVRWFSESDDFSDTQLWLFDMPKGDARKRAYLPLTGLVEDDITIVPQSGDLPVDEMMRSAPPFIVNRTTQLVSLLKEKKPAILHAWLDASNLCGGLAGLMAGVPRIILHTHNMRPSKVHGEVATSGWSEAYSLLLEREEIHFVNCAQAGLEDYASWMGRPLNERCHVVHNGFDFSSFKTTANLEHRNALRAELGIAPNVPVVGTALRFSAVKQPLIWLDAAKQISLRHPDAHFILFGDGDLREESQTYARQIGISANTHFTGRVEDLSNRLSMLDVFMLSSASEGLPNVLLEAQASGVPVASFDVGGVKETVINGETAKLASPQSVSELASAVDHWISNKDEWMQASAASQRFVREQFSETKMMNALTEVLRG